jgi:hypothetical protein
MTDKYDGAKFIHLQEDAFTADGEVPYEYGGATLAYKEVDGDTYVGIAHCHEKDRYVKAYGRAKAIGYMRQLIARPELDGNENMRGVRQFIVSGEPDHEALIVLMEEEGYVPR